MSKRNITIKLLCLIAAVFVGISTSLVSPVRADEVNSTLSLLNDTLMHARGAVMHGRDGHAMEVADHAGEAILHANGLIHRLAKATIQATDQKEQEAAQNATRHLEDALTHWGEAVDDGRKRHAAQAASHAMEGLSLAQEAALHIDVVTGHPSEFHHP